MADDVRNILDNLADGIIVTDRKGRFVHFNRVAERILGNGALGVPPRQWTSAYGCYLPDTVTPFPPDRLPLTRVLKGETVSEQVVFVRNANLPEGAFISIRSNPLTDGEGRLSGAVVAIRDVTRQRAELQKLKHLSNVVEQTADSVVITDRNGVVKYVNPGFEKTSGYTAAEMVGRTPALLKSGRHDREFYRLLWTTLLQGKVFQGTLFNRRKNGELYVTEQTITPIVDSSGTITEFVSIGKDITLLRRAAEQETRMSLAREVQQRLYPRVVPDLPGFDLAGATFPADLTGGDYFDYIRLENGRVAIAVADVSGHGIDAALVMAATRAHLRSIARGRSDCGEILSILNRALGDDIPDDRLVMLFLGALDPSTGTLRFAGAGHTPGYVIRRSGKIRMMLKATGAPLGMTKDVIYDTGDPVLLEPGESLILFTDGITEARSPVGRFFGLKRALACVREHAGSPASEVVQCLHDAVRDFRTPHPQDDDITIVVCKRT